VFLYLSQLFVDHISIDISKVQDDEIGDGTTSVVVLASELLRVYFLFFFILYYLSLKFIIIIIGNRKFDFTKNSSSNYYFGMA
jgi:hypothetical protein